VFSSVVQYSWKKGLFNLWANISDICNLYPPRQGKFIEHFILNSGCFTQKLIKIIKQKKAMEIKIVIKGIKRDRKMKSKNILHIDQLLAKHCCIIFFSQLPVLL